MTCVQPVAETFAERVCLFQLVNHTAIGVDAVIAPLLLGLIVGVIGVNSSVICVAEMDHFSNFAPPTVAATVEWLICLFYGAVYAEQRRTKLR